MDKSGSYTCPPTRPRSLFWPGPGWWTLKIEWCPGAEAFRPFGAEKPPADKIGEDLAGKK
jgi:hypothetical protein